MSKDNFNNYMIKVNDPDADEDLLGRCVIRLISSPSYKKARKRAEYMGKTLKGSSTELFEYNGDPNKPFLARLVGGKLWENIPQENVT